MVSGPGFRLYVLFSVRNKQGLMTDGSAIIQIFMLENIKLLSKNVVMNLNVENGLRKAASKRVQISKCDNIRQYSLENGQLRYTNISNVKLESDISEVHSSTVVSDT